MPDRERLGPWLRRFLTEYIVTERNLARNTRASYRDTFKLLLPFASRKMRKPVERLTVDDLTSGLVLRFLAHLEHDRGCSMRTRNQRLAAIRAFARFVGSRDPAHVEWSGHIRAIAAKKSIQPPVGWLTRTEMEALLAVPDRRTRRGQSEYALLLFLYNTGARVSEVTQLKVQDLALDRDRGSHDLATLHGKGGKTRQCPLWPETERVLADKSSAGRRTPRCSSAGSVMPSLGLASTGSSSVAPQTCQEWRDAGSPRTSFATRQPAISCSPASTSTPSGRGSAMSRSARRTSMPRSTSR